MKITEIRAFLMKTSVFAPTATVEPRRPGWGETAEVANPMSRYPRFKPHRSLWRTDWPDVGCLVRAEDGTWGLGMSRYGGPVVSIINDHVAPLLLGEECLATEKLWDMMFRITSPYSAGGLSSYAISAVDLALWDLKGKLLGQPVYKLLGGPVREKQFCYATGNDTDWQMELGFQAYKLACPYGPADGLAGMARNEELVAKTRELIGPERELMLDCWMAFDVEYTVRLAETLRPYRLRWMEECLLSEDFDAHVALRARLPWQTLSTGEHWYTHVPFQWAANHHVVDILQPDINWVGGVTTTRKICAIADAAGISVMLHGGARNAYGQHLSYAMPAVPWLEYFVGTAPGVPLDQAARLPGEPVAVDGFLTPSDAPGFGLEVPESWLEPFFA
jgi:L-rhamnonate dehydratase